MSFGETLRELRKQKGFTQESLGERLSLAPQTISKWERGESMPDAGLLPTLAKTLGCSLDTLFGMGTDSWEDAEKALIRWVMTVPDEELPRALMALPAFVRKSLEKMWSIDLAASARAVDRPEYHKHIFIAERPEWLTVDRRGGDLPFAVTFPDVPAVWEGMEDKLAAMSPLWELLADADGRKAVLRILREQNMLIMKSAAAAELGIEKEETLEKLRKVHLWYPLCLTVDGKPTDCVSTAHNQTVLALLLLASCTFVPDMGPAAEAPENAEKPAE